MERRVLEAELPSNRMFSSNGWDAPPRRAPRMDLVAEERRLTVTADSSPRVHDVLTGMGVTVASDAESKVVLVRFSRMGGAALVTLDRAPRTDTTSVTFLVRACTLEPLIKGHFARKAMARFQSELDAALPGQTTYSEPSAARPGRSAVHETVLDEMQFPSRPERVRSRSGALITSRRSMGVYLTIALMALLLLVQGMFGYEPHGIAVFLEVAAVFAASIVIYPTRPRHKR